MKWVWIIILCYDDMGYHFIAIPCFFAMKQQWKSFTFNFLYSLLSNLPNVKLISFDPFVIFWLYSISSQIYLIKFYFKTEKYKIHCGELKKLINLVCSFFVSIFILLIPKMLLCSSE